MPAPLDLQLNGYRGLDFGAADLSRERLAGICRAYRADGGGRFLATVITDALPLLERAGGLVRTGPTGTNVADVRIILARP